MRNPRRHLPSFGWLPNAESDLPTREKSLVSRPAAYLSAAWDYRDLEVLINSLMRKKSPLGGNPPLPPIERRDNKGPADTHSPANKATPICIGSWVFRQQGGGAAVLPTWRERWASSPTRP